MTDLSLTATPGADGEPSEGFNWYALATTVLNASTQPDTPLREGRRLSQLQLLRTRPGGAIPLVYGRMRVGGQVIWASQLAEHISETGGDGDKGGSPSTPRRRDFRYTMHVAIGLCGRQVSHLGRVWADGRLLDKAQLSLSLYHGTATQSPDPLIEADLGAGDTPAFRGLAYVVLRDFDLTAHGNRLPQLSFEVFAPLDEQADSIQGVAIIPGATEFGYHPDPHARILGIGRAVSENVTAHAGLSGWDMSLNELQDTHAACKQVSLVVAWFGNDLRLGHCRLEPRVESHLKNIVPSDWQVAGLNRQAANLVSAIDGRPAFGGTPSDASVVAAIKDLKQRGFEVLFSPFIMMDVAADNQLPDPYGASQQEAYPWRGRITCHPAPDQPETPNGTDEISDGLAHFIDGNDATDSWCLRGMVAHYAALCAEAGGVDGFLIASELPGMSGLRDGRGNYPFADHLVELAQLARGFLPEAKISYAANWSEYGAKVAANGDVGFPLDGFWGHAACDFIGIDAYFPLADWRDGAAHLDAQAGAKAITEDAYLQANVAGGEYFDWYYADAAARQSQTRTAITDGFDNDPDNNQVWMYRAKDVRGWWAHPHHPRIGGVKGAATAWQAESKPIWFTEVGCPAVDKGANQPNLFPDSKSAVARLPYFSNGQRDDHTQRAFLAAFSTYYRNPAHNPSSTHYDGVMVPHDKIYVWAWDARPFPAFPYRTDIWVDGVNWHTGHWINGRSAATPLALLLEDVAASGGAQTDISAVHGVVEGFIINGVRSPRQALTPLLTAFGIDSLSGASRLRFFGRSDKPICTINRDDILAANGRTSLRYHEADTSRLPNRLDLHYLDAEGDYGVQCVSAHYRGGERPVLSLTVPLALSSYTALSLASRLLHEVRQTANSVTLDLPPRYMALEAGDVISIDQRLWRITQISLLGHIEVSAVRHEVGLYQPQLSAPQTQASLSATMTGTGIVARPVLHVLDLPAQLPLKSQPLSAPGQPLLACFAAPWPSQVHVRDTSDGFIQSLSAPSIIGETQSPLAAAPCGRWDVGGRLRVSLYGGVVQSVTRRDVLQGANVLAVQTPLGWEVMQFAEAELVDENCYVLSDLLRGQNGSDAVMVEQLAAGAPVVFLSSAMPPLDLPLSRLSQQVSLQFGAASLPLESYGWQTQSFDVRRAGLTCLAPAHVSQNRRENGDIEISWIRRSRLHGDDFDAIEVPLGEANEAYEVAIEADGERLYTATTQTPSWVYEAGLQASHRHAAQRLVRIAQISATQGAGYASYLELNFA